MNEETAAAELEEVTVEIPSETTAALNEDEEIVAEAPEIAEMEADTADLLESIEEADAPEEILAATGYNGYCGKDGTNLTWMLTKGVLTIRGEGEMQDFPNDVPWYDQCDKITTVNIENGVTTIGESAFSYCTNLTSIEIPNSVTSIGDAAFSCCTNLTSIEIPNSVISIGEFALSSCGWINIKIPNSVTYIDSCAFYYCTNLTSIEIPISVTYIGDEAFNRCSKLKDVYYAGTEENFMKIFIDEYNDPLFEANIHYNSSSTVDYSKVVPKLIGATSTTNGITIQWNAVDGLSKYRVYRKTAGTGWKKLEDVAVTSYTDTTVETGVKYTYTVRGIAGNTVVTSYNKTGISTTFTTVPKLVSLTAYSTGITIEWESFGDLIKYRIYRKVNGGSWKKLEDVGGISYTDTTVKDGVTYAYTVRGMDGNSLITHYDKMGLSVTYNAATAAPKPYGAFSVNLGILFVWDGISGSNKYRVYRRKAGGSWIKLKDVSNSTYYFDTTAKSGTMYYYTVRGMDGSKLVTDYDKTGVSATR